MNIYKLDIESYNDDYICEFYISTQSIHWKNIQKTKIGMEYLENWEIPEIQLYKENLNKVANPNDFLNLWGLFEAPIVTKKVKDIFDETQGIQFLPIKLTTKYLNIEQEYFLMNIFNYIDCLNIQKSKILMSKNNHIISIKKYVFSEILLSNKNNKIFKLEINKIKKAIFLYVTDEFKQIVEKNNITGLKFEKIYEFE